MKKLVMLVVVAAVVALAGSAMAQFPTSVGGAVKKAAKVGVAAGINKELKSGKYVCTWDMATKSVKDCNLKEIAAYLSGKRTALETGGAAAGSYTDFDIKVNTKDYDAYNKVKGELQKFGVGSWDIYKKDGPADKITFEVAIQ